MVVEIPEPPIEEEIVIIGEAPYFTTPVQDRYVRLRLSSGYIEPIYLGDIVVDAGENYDDIVQQFNCTNCHESMKGYFEYDRT